MGVIELVHGLIVEYIAELGAVTLAEQVSHLVVLVLAVLLLLLAIHKVKYVQKQPLFQPGFELSYISNTMSF